MFTRRFLSCQSLRFSAILVPAACAKTVGASQTAERSMKENTFDASLLETRLVADLVVASDMY